MPCQICASPQREVINQALQAGESPYRLATRYQVNRSSLRSHAANQHYADQGVSVTMPPDAAFHRGSPVLSSKAPPQGGSSKAPRTMTQLRAALDALDAELAMLHKASQHLAAHQLYTRATLVADLARFGLDWLPDTDHRPTLKEAVDARLTALHPTYPALRAAADEATSATQRAMEAHWQTVAAQLTPEALATVPCLTPLPVEERQGWATHACSVEATCGPWRSLGVLAPPRIVTQRLATYQLRELRRATSAWLRATFPFTEEDAL